MEKVRLAIQSSETKAFIELLNNTYSSGYVRDLENHHVFIAESNSYLLSYNTTMTVIIEHLNDKLIIDIVVTGGAMSLLGSVFRSPYKEAKYLANKIVDYCNNHGIQGHQVKGASTF